MPADCVHGGGWENPDNGAGYLVRVCALVGNWPTMPEAQCLKCSGSDDGTSPASQVILTLLEKRILSYWNAPAAGVYFACPLSLDDAVEQLKARNVQYVRDALTAAVTGGMPLAQAEQLATAHGISLDG